MGSSKGTKTGLSWTFASHSSKRTKFCITHIHLPVLTSQSGDFCIGKRCPGLRHTDRLQLPLEAWRANILVADVLLLLFLLLLLALSTEAPSGRSFRFCVFRSGRCKLWPCGGCSCCVVTIHSEGYTAQVVGVRT